MFLFSFNPTAPTDIYTLSLHDALPICLGRSHWTADPAVEIGFLFPDDLACDRRVVGAAINRSVRDRKSTRLNSSHTVISYAVFCLKKKKEVRYRTPFNH